MDFPFSFNEKSALLLIFFVHGLVFTGLVGWKAFKDRQYSHRWLSLLLFLYSMYLVPYMLGYAGWYSEDLTREIMFFVPFMQVLLIGPVIYFYTRSLLNVKFRLSKVDLFHFLPAATYLVYSLIVFVTDKLILDEFYFYADGRDKDLEDWYQTAGLISMVSYLVLSLKLYANYKKLVFERVSFAESILFRWIPRFMIAFMIILILRAVFFFTNSTWVEFGSQFWHYISFSIVFYYISINGYSNAVKVSVLQGKKSLEVDVFEEAEEDIEENNSVEKENTELDVWKPKLLKLIQEDRIFENSTLTLADVATELNTTTKTISKVVNTSFEMNFNDFINYYRVEALKEKIDNAEHEKTTLLGLAFDCGFNSKATFNRAFKKSTGLSPREYVDTRNK